MRLRPVAVGLLCVLVAASCGSSGGSGTTPSSPTGPSSAPTTVIIEIRGILGALSFSPNPARVEPGVMVVWRNVDDEVHRVVLRNPEVDTGDIQPGQSTQPRPLGGVSRPYFCSVHPEMVGRLNDAPEPQPTGDENCPYEGYC
jgi:plastocyanin